MEDGSDAYLTSIGFLGPGFASYYPDCCSVFGFWDHFKDNTDISLAITENNDIQFKASYQVVGWIDGGINDPLNDIADLAKNQYNEYVNQSIDKGTTIDQTPTDYYLDVIQSNLGWQFNAADISFTLDENQRLTTLDSPDKTICNGIMQEVVWNMLNSPQSSYFLQNTKNELDNNGATWTDTVDVAVGNTPLQVSYFGAANVTPNGSSGFNSMLGGYYESVAGSNDNDVGSYGYYWSSTPDSGSQNYRFCTSSTTTDAGSAHDNDDFLSVRYVRDIHF